MADARTGAAEAAPAQPDGDRYRAGMPSRDRPKVVIRADLLPAVSVLSTISLIGIPLGWLWARLAPPLQVQITADGSVAVLGMESWLRFDGMAIFLLLGMAGGVVAGVLAWMLRERRGPVVMVAAVAGSLLAAWLAMLMGEAFTASMYEVPESPEVGDVVTEAPQLDTVWVLVAQPFAAALVYGLLAAWNGMDDLGRRLG